MTDETTRLAVRTKAGRSLIDEFEPGAVLPGGSIEEYVTAIESEAAGVTVSGEGLREALTACAEALHYHPGAGFGPSTCEACAARDQARAALAASPEPAALDVERLARAGGLFARIDALNAALTALNAALAHQSDTPEDGHD